LLKYKFITLVLDQNLFENLIIAKVKCSFKPGLKPDASAETKVNPNFSFKPKLI